MTLFVAPLDTFGITETPGLGAFVDPKLNDVVKRWPAKDRVNADELALLFAMLRPNDLIWNYWVNNYLMGKQPAAFDVLLGVLSSHHHGTGQHPQCPGARVWRAHRIPGPRRSLVIMANLNENMMAHGEMMNLKMQR